MVSSWCVESGTSADARPAARMPAKIKVVESIVNGRSRSVLPLKSKMRNEHCRAMDAAGGSSGAEVDASRELSDVVRAFQGISEQKVRQWNPSYKFV